MTLQPFIASIQEDESFSACITTQRKVIYFIEKLHKIEQNISYLDGNTIEKCLDEASLRYREVKLGSDFAKFDFGLILIVKQDIESYYILSRINGVAECIQVTNNQYALVALDVNLLELND